MLQFCLLDELKLERLCGRSITVIQYPETLLAMVLQDIAVKCGDQRYNLFFFSSIFSTLLLFI